MRRVQVSTDWLLRPGGRPLFIFAHQDDETVLAGIIQRVVGADERGTFVWWTNGDGLAPGVGMAPEAYGEMRIRECTEALARLGASEARKIDLRSSEIQNYRRFTHVAMGGALRATAFEYFLREADRVEEAVRRADPDRVFLLAWQGGHPEHDLVHLMTVRAVRKLRRETGRAIPIAQCPAYEYVIACALRFKPWYRGDRRRIELSEGERERKRAAFEAYPSQQDLFKTFRWAVRAAGIASALRGRFQSVEDYLGIEELGLVDPDLDYRQPTHRLERLNYMLDDFEGIPVRFSSMISPLAEMLLLSEPAA